MAKLRETTIATQFKNRLASKRWHWVALTGGEGFKTMAAAITLVSGLVNEWGLDNSLLEQVPVGVDYISQTACLGSLSRRK